MGTTSNFAFRYPASTDPVRPYTDIQNLASDVDALLRRYLTQYPSVYATDATSRTTTSTSFTGTLSPAGLCAVTFKAPPSGKVLVVFGVELANSSNFFTFCAPALRTGTTLGAGTVVSAASFDAGVRSDQSTLLRVGASWRYTGLTEGADYNCSLEQLVGSGTGTYVRRSVDVIPLLS